MYNFLIWLSHMAIDTFWTFEFASFSGQSFWKAKIRCILTWQNNLLFFFTSSHIRICFGVRVWLFWYCHIHQEGKKRKAKHISRPLWGNWRPTCLVKPDGGASLCGVVTFISPSGVLRRYQRLAEQMKIETSEQLSKNHPSWQIQWRLPGHSRSPRQMHMARAPHEDGLRAPLCFRKLIYYYSHPAPLHALLSICTVVLAVCSNLLLF